MSKLRESAIELLKSAPDHINGHWPELDEVVKALAQPDVTFIDEGNKPEQEPVLWKWSGDGWSYEKPMFPATPLYAAPPSKQDTRLKVKLGRQYGGDLNGHWFYLQPADEYAEQALTKHSGISAPPCKPWVSLTDDELSVIWGEFGLALMPVRKAIANEIEAKLKELNHG